MNIVLLCTMTAAFERRHKKKFTAFDKWFKVRKWWSIALIWNYDCCIRSVPAVGGGREGWRNSAIYGNVDSMNVNLSFAGEIPPREGCNRDSPLCGAFNCVNFARNSTPTRRNFCFKFAIAEVAHIAWMSHAPPSPGINRRDFCIIKSSSPPAE